jgi:hypothetical protein
LLRSEKINRLIVSQAETGFAITGICGVLFPKLKDNNKYKSRRTIDVIYTSEGEITNAKMFKMRKDDSYGRERKGERAFFS